jgi:hypothetical protein
MAAEDRRSSQYDAYAHASAALGAQRAQGDADDDQGLLLPLLALLGGRDRVPGAGRGLWGRLPGAHPRRPWRVGDPDRSLPRRVALARAKDTAGAGEYRVAAVRAPLSDDAARFDASTGVGRRTFVAHLTAPPGCGRWPGKCRRGCGALRVHSAEE